jgi:hypothetical protein
MSAFRATAWQVNPVRRSAVRYVRSISDTCSSQRRVARIPTAIPLCRPEKRGPSRSQVVNSCVKFPFLREVILDHGRSTVGPPVTWALGIRPGRRDTRRVVGPARDYARGTARRHRVLRVRTGLAEGRWIRRGARRADRSPTLGHALMGVPDGRAAGRPAARRGHAADGSAKAGDGYRGRHAWRAHRGRRHGLPFSGRGRPGSVLAALVSATTSSGSSASSSARWGFHQVAEQIISAARLRPAIIDAIETGLRSEMAACPETAAGFKAGAL